MRHTHTSRAPTSVPPRVIPYTAPSHEAAQRSAEPWGVKIPFIAPNMDHAQLYTVSQPQNSRAGDVIGA
jgi:hypothetical protein